MFQRGQLIPAKKGREYNCNFSTIEGCLKSVGKKPLILKVTTPEKKLLKWSEFCTVLRVTKHSNNIEGLLFTNDFITMLPFWGS